MTIHYDQFFTPIAGQIEKVLPRLPLAFTTFLVGYLSIRFLQWVIGTALHASRLTRAMQDILTSVTSIILWIGLIALLFQSLGLNQIAIALSGSVAIIGLGIATGANKLVSDILAGLFLARNRDFKIGQRIKMADASGRIHSLDSRKVRILGDDNTLYVVPNTKFDEQTWQIVPDNDKDKEKKDD